MPGRPVAGTTHDAPELLGVEMEQVTGVLVLAAVGRLALPGADDEALAIEHPMTGRGRQPEERTEAIGTPAERATQGHDAGLIDARQPLWARAWPGAVVDETGVAPCPPARQPAMVEATADPEGETGRAHGHARLHGGEDLGATSWRQRGVGVTMHRGAFPSGCCSATLPYPVMGPSL